MRLDGLKILLAEDSAGNRLVARRMLESLGAAVSAVEDGARALELLATERFDVALIDIEMPRVSGLEVIRRARAAAPDGGGPVLVALTASGGAGTHADIVAAGAAGVLSKLGVSPERLGHEIRRLLDRAPGGAPPGSRPAGADAEVDPAIYRALAAAVGERALGDFLATVEEDVAAADAELVAAAEAGDMAGVRRATHVLVGVAGAIGAVGLQRLAERLNQAAHAADPGGVAALAAAAHAEAARLGAFLARERREAGP